MEHREFNFNVRIPWPTAKAGDAPLTRFLPTPGNVIFTLLMIGLLLWVSSAGALPLRLLGPDAPSTNTIAYQGRLADAGGAPLTGTYSIIFRLYSTAAGGVPLWEEQWTGTNGVRVSDGLFNVMLGSLTSIPQAVVTGSNILWLGITVGTDNEMAPRVQLGSVPFAVQALTVPDSSVTTAKIADQAVTQAKLAPDVSVVPPDGSITTAKLAETAVTQTKLADHAISVSKFSSGTVVNRYFIEWFGDETPCTANGTQWVECGTTLGYGFALQFPSEVAGTIRRYRLMAAYSDNLAVPGTTFLRVYRKDNGAEVYLWGLGRIWALADFELWRYSEPIQFDLLTHLELQIRVSEPGYSAWLYRVWLMAEDIVP